jgi:Domain of unknown function (DUF4105)
MQEQSQNIWVYSWFRDSLFFFSRTFWVAWSIIKVLWYWLERITLVVLLLWITVWLAWWLSQRASLYRDWLPAEAVLSDISFSGNLATVRNVRNHQWITDKEFTPWYYDAVYNLDEIERVYYVITPFSDRDGPAHTMLSFSFSGGQHVAISAEVRKERGEDFDALKWILNQFELMYVIADESDVIKLRTNYRKNQVYMYPIQTGKDEMRKLFRSMLIRTDKIGREPEFYNTLWNNCTTSILDHANALRTDKLSWGIYRILPSHSDQIVHEAWLIDTKLPLEEARAYYRIDEIARSAWTGSVYSEIIRKPIR